MPQKTRLIDILSRKWRFDARNTPREGPWRLQIDKMSKKEFFAAVCDNEKKAVTLSVLNDLRNDIYTFIIYNF